MNKNVNEQYSSLLSKIMGEGYLYKDKKRDVMCRQIDTATLDIDLTKGFPAINLKPLWWKGVVGELLWFLRGDTNIKYLLENNIHIWDKDAYNYYLKEPIMIGVPQLSYEDWLKRVKSKNWSHGINGDLGRIYGAQWRTWQREYIPLDQIGNLIRNLKEKPMDRRHIVTAWNPAELDKMALPPCHWSFEIIVRPLTPLQAAKYGEVKGKPVKTIKHSGYGFTLKWHQRSVDTYLGLPFNIASYALLAHIIGVLTGYKPLRLVGDLSNVHLYENAWDAARIVSNRNPYKYAQPTLGDIPYPKFYSLDRYFERLSIEDFKLNNYKSYKNIPVEMLAPIS